jgi:RNA methyltransferase, TrmH family
MLARGGIRLSEEDVVTSRGNPLVKRFRRLKERGTDGGVMLIEGGKLLREAIAAGIGVVEAAVSARGAAAWPDLALALAEAGVPVRRMDDAVLASLSEAETSQGILAVARIPVRVDDPADGGTPLVLVLAGVQNPGNVGALLRVAEAAGATGAWLTMGCADPFSWKALRGSMGSAFRLPVATGLTEDALVQRLDARGIVGIATEAGAAQSYDEVDYRGPVALLLGNEGAGLPPALVARAGQTVRIPMAAPVESLNVAVAAGVLFFEAARQRAGGR